MSTENIPSADALNRRVQIAFETSLNASKLPDAAKQVIEQDFTAAMTESAASPNALYLARQAVAKKLCTGQYAAHGIEQDEGSAAYKENSAMIVRAFEDAAKILAEQATATSRITHARFEKGGNPFAPKVRTV